MANPFTWLPVTGNLEQLIESRDSIFMDLFRYKSLDDKTTFLIWLSTHLNLSNCFPDFYNLISNTDPELTAKLFMHSIQNSNSFVKQYLLDNNTITNHVNHAIFYDIFMSYNDTTRTFNELANAGIVPCYDKFTRQLYLKIISDTMQYGHINNMKTLIATGGYIKSNDVDTILIRSAIISQTIEKIKLVIEELDIDINSSCHQMNNDDISDIAVMMNNNIMRYLLEIGLDPNVSNGILLKNAIRYGREETTKMLISFGGDITLLDPIHLENAIFYGSVTFIELLIQNGINFDQLDNKYQHSTKHEHIVIDELENLGIKSNTLAKILASRLWPDKDVKCVEYVKLIEKIEILAISLI